MYYGIANNPDKLSDNEWALRLAHLRNIRKLEAENSLQFVSQIIIAIATIAQNHILKVILKKSSNKSNKSLISEKF